MAKWHRRQQQRNKRQRQQRQQRQPIRMLTVTKDGRTAVGPATDAMVSMRYIAAHRYVPAGIETWSEQRIREVAAGVVPDELNSWERALIVLAHHQSRLGCELIKALWREAPPELHPFCEQAYAEALMWIGERYPDDQEGEVIFVSAEGGKAV